MNYRQGTDIALTFVADLNCTLTNSEHNQTMPFRNIFDDCSVESENCLSDTRNYDYADQLFVLGKPYGELPSTILL